MVGMRVRVDDEVDAQPVARGLRQVAVDLARLGVDQRGGAALAAADEVGLAASGGNLLEDHGGPSVRPRKVDYSPRAAARRAPVHGSTGKPLYRRRGATPGRTTSIRLVVNHALDLL